MKWIFAWMCLSLGVLQASEWAVEARAGYFYPSSHLFRKIYSSGVEGEVQAIETFSRHFQAWANAGYFSKKGHSIGFRDRTDLRLVPLSMGMNYMILPCTDLNPYVGVGFCYSFLTINNHFERAKKHFSKAGAGFVIKSGLYINLPRCFLLDIFLDYTNQMLQLKVDSERSYINIGGIRTGIGIGYRL